MSRLRVVGALALLLLARSAEAQVGPAPTGRCQFDVSGPPTNHSTLVKLPSGQYNTYWGGGVVARCPSQHIVLKSDSLEIYGDEARYFFIGHVDYDEPRLNLKSEFLTYFQRDERLLAFFNVDAHLPTGSRLVGNQLEVFRAIPNVRKQHGSSINRPTITIIEKDSSGKEQPPVNVTGNTVWFEGDSTVASSGQVIVVRPEMTASGDSLYLDGSTGLLRLMRSPRVVGTKGRPFTLVGETIDVLSKQRKLDRVLAKTNGHATSNDLDLKSDTIDLRISNDVLQRAISWGASRAHAVSPTQSILADSIDVVMPDQKLREMHALRMAVAEGAPDSIKFHTTEKDRLSGDTIVAFFDTSAAAVRDTTSKPRITRLTAIGNATSLQHVAPRDTSLRTPAIVYVAGTSIVVTFDSGAVRKVTVQNKQLASGVYLEPVSPTQRTRGTTPAGAPAGTPAQNAPAPTGAPPARAATPATSPVGARPTTSTTVPPNRP